MEVFKTQIFCCNLNGCLKEYASKYNLIRHVRINHLKAKAGKCEICGKKFVSIDDINRIATSMDVQAASFKPVCVGMGTAKRNNRDEKTFYIVVESARLVEIRQAIENEFIVKGGRPGDFSATKFFPHITVGFTQTDLHESDGVIKDKNSCVLNIEER